MLWYVSLYPSEVFIKKVFVAANPIQQNVGRLKKISPSETTWGKLEYYIIKTHFILSLVTVVVALLVDRLFQIPEVCSSNPVIGKNLYTININCIEKIKRPWMAGILRTLKNHFLVIFETVSYTMLLDSLSREHSPMGGSITVQLTTSLTVLDLIKQAKL